jgi:predicted  nucleic acid-binding Zn-ribbon protein
MPTKEDKVKINARVPQGLYDWVSSVYGNVSQAVNDGLVLLKESKACDCDTSGPQVGPLEPTSQTDELKAILDTLKAAEKSYETQQVRIEDMKAQVHALYDQLHTKDGQIEKLNESVHKQAVHIQTLIQENSRLNVKLLPEVTESKKPWWRLW